MATPIKLDAFVNMGDMTTLTMARKTGIPFRTIYYWLNDDKAEYIVDYDARNNKVKKITKQRIDVLYEREEK